MVVRPSRRELTPRARLIAPVIVGEATRDETYGPEPATEDEKIAVWCLEMLKRGAGSDLRDVRYVRGCAQREADTIRPTRPDLAAKLDAVAATLSARLPADPETEKPLT